MEDSVRPSFRNYLKVALVFTIIFVSGCSLEINLKKGKDKADDTSSKISISSSTALNITEGSQSTILFILSKKLPENVTLNWTLNSGVGIFTQNSGTVNLAKDAENFSIMLEAANDSTYYPLRSYDFTITLPTSVFQSQDLDIQVQLTDNETAPVYTFQTASHTIGEGAGTTTVTVTSTQVAGVDGTLQFTYAGTATHTDDYVRVTSLNFPAGQTTATLSIDIEDDALIEGDETIDITLSSSSFGSIGVADAHEIEITDNETNIGAFDIDGVTGNTDITEDALLNSTLFPTINWGSATSATSYDVTILDSTGNSTVCVTQTSMGLDYNFSACSLTAGTTYKARVVAKAGAASREATNSPYSFLVNRAPSVTNETITMMYNGAAITFNPIANDSDPDGHTVTATAVGSASKGTTALLAGNSIRYTPTGGFTNVGVDSFTYTVSDGNGATSTGTVTVRLMTIYTWTGASNNNWSTGANWCGTVSSPGLSGTCPGGSAPSNAATNTHRAFFNSTICSGASCNVNINANAQAYAITMQSDYTGTITQQATRTLTVGPGAYTQNAGTFVGADADIYFAGNSAINAGTFTSTSANLNMYYSGLTIAPAATFNHGNGTLLYTGEYNGSVRTLSINGVTLNNFTANTDRGSTLDLAGGTFTVLGTLNFSNANTFNSLDNGTIEAKGNIVVPESTEAGVWGSWGGTALIRVSGSGNQTITGYGTHSVSPAMEIASTGGTVTFVGTLEIRYGFRYIQGNVDFGSSTIEFIGMYNEGNVNVDSGSLQFNNVYVESSRYSSINLVTPMHVKGNLTIADSDNYTTTGIFNVEGNVSFGSNLADTTMQINLIGSNNQTIGRNASPNSMLVILNVNKTGGTATMTSNITLLGGSFGDFTLSAGDFNLNGFTLTAPDTITFGAGTNVYRNGGTYTAPNIVNNGANIF